MKIKKRDEINKICSEIEIAKFVTDKIIQVIATQRCQNEQRNYNDYFQFSGGGCEQSGGKEQ